jgi:hypothetical protein
MASVILCLLLANLAAAQRLHYPSGYAYAREVAQPQLDADAAEVPETEIPTRAAEEEGLEEPATESEEEAEEEAEEDEYAPWTLFPEECETRIGGWEQIGYHDGSTGLFNDRPGKLNLHQSWLWIENEADGEKGFDLGFRADIVYGIDGQDTQAFGNPPGTWDFENGFDHGPYAWAIPQAYGSVAMGDLGVKIGHFYTPMGYEVVPAPGNFFYSHALTMYNSEPFTHTGFLATYPVCEHLEVYAGWTLGWDTGYEQFAGGSNWLGGFALSLTEKLRMTYISTAGDFGWRGEGYSHSLVFDWTISDKWHYVLQSDLVASNGVVVPEDGVGTLFLPGELDDNVGINQYLFYTISPKLAAGVRAEWWKSDGASFYEVTYGLNIRPHPNFVLRPEVRHQWSPTDALDFEDNNIFGIDAYVTF